jgi:two-component system nitrate/nitrite response regulator NarL
MVAKVDAETPRTPVELTDRERVVLELIAAGYTDKEIALKAGLSKYTINLDVRRILQKIGAASRTEAAIKAIKTGLID